MTLIPVDPALAAEVVGSAVPSREYAWDFPAEGDLVICSLVSSGDIRGASRSWPWGPWLICADSTIVGTAGFKGAPRGGVVEIGYGVCASQRRRGIATAAVGILSTTAGLHGASLSAETAPDNLASHAVLRACGFTPDDEQRPTWWSKPL